MSDDFPYTPEQVNAFAEAVGRSGFTATGQLWDLHDAGITLSFPEPRFYAQSRLSDTSWLVKDRTFSGYIAKFCAPDGRANEKRARDFADRLNREDAP